MTGMLMALAARTGAAGRMRRVVAAGIGLVLLIAILAALWGAWSLFDAMNDRQAIRRDRVEATAELRERQVAVERSTGEAKRDRDTRAGEQRQKLEEAVNEAYRENRSPVDAYFDELRRQQDAGSNP